MVWHSHQHVFLGQTLTFVQMIGGNATIPTTLLLLLLSPLLLLLLLLLSPLLLLLLRRPEETLVSFICAKIMKKPDARSVLNDVEAVLDEEAEQFVFKMWRVIIFETKIKRAQLEDR
jgi:RNA-binding protein 25